MDGKLRNIIIGGAIGTLVMTMAMSFALLLGWPMISLPNMVAEIIEIAPFLGWIMHFVIGVLFSFVYALLLDPLWKVNQNLKGVTFGVILSILASVMILAMNQIQLVTWQDSYAMMSLIFCHVIYGIVVVELVGSSQSEEGCFEPKMIISKERSLYLSRRLFRKFKAS